MHLPIEFTDSPTDVLSVVDLMTFWNKTDYDKIDPIPFFKTLINYHSFKEKYQVNNTNYTNVFVGWRWRITPTDEEYIALLTLVTKFLQEKAPQFTQFNNSYKNFKNHDPDYNYILLLLLQKSTQLPIQHVLFSIFQSRKNKQHLRTNDTLLQNLQTVVNIDSFFLDFMDFTHLGLGLAAIYVFYNQNYISRDAVFNLIHDIKYILQNKNNN
jgi:hypothetical protein